MPHEIKLDNIDLDGIIHPGEQIVWCQRAGEPATLVEKLLEQRHRLGRDLPRGSARRGLGPVELERVSGESNWPSRRLRIHWIALS
jgi:hypothetical protein